MAKQCKECHSTVEDKDVLCPNCGAVLLETGGRNHPDSGVDRLLNSMLQEQPPVFAKQSAAAMPEAPQPSSARATAADESGTGALFGTLNPEEEAGQTRDLPVDSPAEPPPPKNRNALESSFHSPPRNAYGNKTSKVLIVVVVLAILALFAAIVTLILLPMQQQKQERLEITSFLEGSWISDKFAFTDSTAKNYVEVLTVDADGNFTMLHAVPDEAYPDGWKTGMWEVEDTYTGRIDYIAEEQRLLLLYEEDGVNYFFDRTFIVKEEDTICLREYYDESKTSFYDVNLYRIDMG